MAAALALFTSLAYGVSNFVGPTLSKDSPRFVVLIAGQALALIVSVAVVVGASQAVPDAKVWATAALAGIGNAWGLLAFYRAAEVGSLSIVTPVSSLAVLIPVTAGVIDGEPLGPAKIAGLVLALGGVALATRRKEPGQGDVRAAAAVGAVRRDRLRDLLHRGQARLGGRRLLGDRHQPRDAARGVPRRRAHRQRRAQGAARPAAGPRRPRPAAVRRHDLLRRGDPPRRPERRLRARARCSRSSRSRWRSRSAASA